MTRFPHRYLARDRAHRYPAGDGTVVLPTHTAARHGRGDRALSWRWRAAGLLNRLIRLAGGLIALTLATHIALVLLHADFHNTFAALVRDVADWASLGLRGLFADLNRPLRVALGNGAALVLWLFAARVVTGVVALLLVPELRRRSYR